MLELHHLIKAYPGKGRALDDVSFALPRGEIVGLLGENGAGKTTLMRMLCGILHPTGGGITLDGLTVDQEDYRASLGYLPQDFGYYPDFSALDFMCYLAALKGLDRRAARRRSLELLETVGLADVARQKVRTFSGGMKQRLGIAVALAGDPDFLVLDEPVNGLDPQGIIEIRELIWKLNREHQITVLISSHILDELARLATHYGFLGRGTLVQEISAQELEAACRKCTRLTVTNAAALCQVLDRQGIEYRLAGEGEVDVYGEGNLTQLILDLSQAGCQVTGLHQRDESLESYYMNLIGGEET